MPQSVVLQIPAASQHVLLARLCAMGCANAAGLALDGVEDAKMIAGEACMLLISQCSYTHIELTFTPEGDALGICARGLGQGSTAGCDDTQFDPAFSAALIEALCSTASIEPGCIRVCMGES